MRGPKQFQLHLVRLSLYLNPYHPRALAPALDWSMRRPAQVQVHEAEKDNEQQKEERPVYLLKQAAVTR